MFSYIKNMRRAEREFNKSLKTIVRSRRFPGELLNISIALLQENYETP